MPGRRQGVDGPAGVGGAALFGGEKVDGDDDADNQVHQEAEGRHDAAGDRRHQGLGVGQHLFRQQAQQVLIVPREAVRDEVLHRRIALQQVRDPGVDGVVVDLHVVPQLQHAPVELRQQDGEQQVAHKADDGPGDEQAHRPGTRGAVLPLGLGLLRRRGEEQVVKEVDDRRQKVCEKTPQQDGGQGVQQLFQQGDEGPAAEKRVVENQDGADRQNGRQRRFPIDALLLHRQPSQR